MEILSFGGLLRKKRMDINMSLREFSRAISYDASNVSKVERGIISPPPTITLRTWAEKLKLEPDSREYQEFLDMAQITRNKIPEDLPSEFRNQLLPAMLRTVRSKDLTKQEFDSLVKLLNK